MGEADNNYNKGIDEIVDLLYSLQRVECSSESAKAKFEKARPVIIKVTELLAARKDFVLYRPMWENLHDRMVYYYDFLNKENLNRSPIPIFRDTLHNELVKWWLKAKKKGILQGPQVHFDTHDDMGLPDVPKKLLTAQGKLKESAILQGACGSIYWPITCMLLSKGIDHVIWAMPKWVYDDNAGFDQSLVCETGNDLLYLRPAGQKKDKFFFPGNFELDTENDLENPKKFRFHHAHRFDRIHMDNIHSWNHLGKMIDSRKFVIDIDLDYFVCNGDKISLKDYKKDFDDIESTGRVHGMPGITTPRTMYSDDHSDEVVHKLNEEMTLIRKRVKSFLNGLQKLKDMGITPCYISISDSTASYFSGNSKRAVFTNQYTPKYFVPILHHLLTQGMRKIYGTRAFY